MKTAYTKYAIIAFSIAALSSMSLAVQASPSGGHRSHNSESQTHSYNGGGHSNYRRHGGGHGGYRSHGYGYGGGHGYGGGYGYGGYGHGGYANYYQSYPVHRVNLLPAIHLPGLSLSLH